jgi:hypothetical protein
MDIELVQDDIVDDNNNNSIDNNDNNDQKRDLVNEKYDVLLQKLQRDINRLVDNDRTSRKRGLQKLLEDIPWDTTNKAQKKAIGRLIQDKLMMSFINIIGNDSLI